jgi:hypothetical protein
MRVSLVQRRTLYTIAHTWADGGAADTFATAVALFETAGPVDVQLPKMSPRCESAHIKRTDVKPAVFLLPAQP